MASHGGSAQRLADLMYALGRAGIAPETLPNGADVLIGDLCDAVGSYPQAVTAIIAPSNLNLPALAAIGRDQRPRLRLGISITPRHSVAVWWQPSAMNGHGDFKAFGRKPAPLGWRENYILHIRGLRHILPPFGGYDPGTTADTGRLVATHVLAIITALFHDVASALGEACCVHLDGVPEITLCPGGAVLDWQIRGSAPTVKPIRAADEDDRGFARGFRTKYGVSVDKVIEVMRARPGRSELARARADLAALGMAVRTVDDLVRITSRLDRILALSEPITPARRQR
jgi:hypothetical protein